MSKYALRLLLLGSLALFPSVLRANEPAIIAKARAFLGTEAALNAINSISYHGTLTVKGLDQPPTALDIIFQKPYCYRAVATSPAEIKVTVLNGYDGWERREDAKDKTRWRMVLYKTDKIKGLRANTWENLAFFRGIEEAGGSLEDLGKATVDGLVCRKLAFIHSPEITFYRYFDQDTGRLVLTETKNGEKIREEGTIMAGGVKFPKELITDARSDDGKEIRITITFDRITVNQPIPAGTFDMPPLISD